MNTPGYIFDVTVNDGRESNLKVKNNLATCKTQPDWRCACFTRLVHGQKSLKIQIDRDHGCENVHEKFGLISPCCNIYKKHAAGNGRKYHQQGAGQDKCCGQAELF